MLTNDKQVDLCLEKICNQGCQTVTQIIQQLERGEIINFTNDLTANQRLKILQELKSIMAVYGN